MLGGLFGDMNCFRHHGNSHVQGCWTMFLYLLVSEMLLVGVMVVLCPVLEMCFFFFL